MSKMQTMADIVRALPFAQHSKREGFDWWRPETADSYSENWERGQNTPFACLRPKARAAGAYQAWASSCSIWSRRPI